MDIKVYRFFFIYSSIDIIKLMIFKSKYLLTNKLNQIFGMIKIYHDCKSKLRLTLPI